MTSADPLGWEVPQSFQHATSYQVRDELQRLVERDLLGPWDGETEEFPPRAAGPRDRYLVGMLGPRRVTAGSEPQPDTDIANEGEGEPELPELLTPQAAGRLWASSMGLSFAVPNHVDALSVRARWGQYVRAERPGENATSRRVWVREPIEHAIPVDVDVPGGRRYWLVGQDPDVFGVWLDVQTRHRDDRRVVRVALVNGQSEDVSPKDLAWMFQTELTVAAPEDASVFLPVRGRVRADDAEERHLDLLYRDVHDFAAGHNVAVHAEARGDRASELQTRWLPTYDVAQVRAGEIPGLVRSMDDLATASADGERLRAGLTSLATGYHSWLEQRRAEAATQPEQFRAAAEAAVERAEKIAARIEAGIELLATNAQARQAFAFANRAMAQQRRNTVVAQRRASAQERSYTEVFAEVLGEGDKHASWRPFQLAFVLINLPALIDPASTERAELVDLLFFPTGGGKTEAYLGLAAFTFAIRRLQGVLGSGADARDGSAGVAVLMRYTLRLLTAQQFQRAAALICAAECLRREDEATWGREPFRIGLWVGGKVSPNWFGDTAEQVAEAREAGARARSTVLQTLVCPWCGTQLLAHRDLHSDDKLRRILLYCANGEGSEACPFSQRRSPDEGLPILTVDEEIYRLLPALVIGTVDKLAQLPWTGHAGTIFGRVGERCPRHGYRHPDLDARTGCGSKHHAAGKLPKVESVALTRLRPPDLIIQDELHLISGALGTTVGLFESAVDELCTWTAGERPAGPKIVASTATTKRAAQQVRRLYARDLAIFPPPVLDVSNTYFSHTVPVSEQDPGRRYLGICAHGVRLKAAEIRVAEILLLAGQTLFDRYGAAADPYLTLVGYFNATRELAGMRRYLDDDVASRLRRNGRRRGMSDRLTPLNQMLTIRELTSRINSGDIAAVLKSLEDPFDPELDTSARRAGILAALRAKQPTPARRDERVPIDVALATSMLQVGVDVPRLGVMVVTGQPKNAAEYIQATSRVGRAADRPGLVVTLYNWARPRDLAHFEAFEHYHATFYRQVEALSVTPFSRRALDRGTAATYLAAIRHADSRYSPNPAAYDVDLDGTTVDQVQQRLLDRAERAGGPSARAYLLERINVVRDKWKQAKTAPARLGYRKTKQAGQQIVGLLKQPGDEPWGPLTVARSMRETENEINLLVPGSGLFDPLYGAPAWTHGSLTAPEADTPDTEPDVGDELGQPNATS